MRTPLIVGNWKMHKTLAEARELVSDLREGVATITGVEILICPPVCSMATSSPHPHCAAR